MDLYQHLANADAPEASGTSQQYYYYYYTYSWYYYSTYYYTYSYYGRKMLQCKQSLPVLLLLFLVKMSGRQVASNLSDMCVRGLGRSC